MSKNTKGPWKLVDGSECEQDLLDSDGKHIVSIHFANNGFNNARLISAAPELLEACKDALQDCISESLLYPYLSLEYSDLYQTLKKAINKAEGDES